MSTNNNELNINKDVGTCFDCTHWIRTKAPEQLMGKCTNTFEMGRTDYRDRRHRDSSCSQFQRRV